MITALPGLFSYLFVCSVCLGLLTFPLGVIGCLYSVNVFIPDILSLKLFNLYYAMQETLDIEMYVCVVHLHDIFTFIFRLWVNGVRDRSTQH